MKQKRALAFLLALLLCLSLLPGSALAAVTAGKGVAIDKENFPDKNFRIYVKQFDTDGNKYLSKAERQAVTMIDVRGQEIKKLNGIEYFTKLSTLYCDYNQLKTLDVSKNTKLMELSCYGNQLTKLDVSKNKQLTRLYCVNNQLTTLNVSKNTKLRWLYCGYNRLTKLDVSKNTKLTTLNVSKNTTFKSLAYDEGVELIRE